MGNVISMNGGILPDHAHIDPDEILENNKGRFSTVVILGWGLEDDLLQICATDGVADTVLLLEQAKLQLLMGNIEE